MVFVYVSVVSCGDFVCVVFGFSVLYLDDFWVYLVKD